MTIPNDGSQPRPPHDDAALPAVAERMVALDDTRLYVRDTGGDGPAVVLLHPASGSAMIWANQEIALARAELRVISYSRRGYWKSQAHDPARPGVGSHDLLALADRLDLASFHLVGSAAGGSIAMDFALSHQDRLLSLAIANNVGGVRDGEIAAAAARIRPADWHAMPVEFRELGPSYRALDPDGAQRWLDLEHRSLTGDTYRQGLSQRVTEASLAGLRRPMLLITGDADLVAPPAIMRMLRNAIPGARLVVAPDAGHSVYWERPDVFNETLLAFFRT